jgi:hypothetical protein
MGNWLIRIKAPTKERIMTAITVEAMTMFLRLAEFLAVFILSFN